MKFNNSLVILVSFIIASLVQTPVLATPTPTPAICSDFLQLTDVEGINIAHPRGGGYYDAVFLFTDLAGSVPAWGLVYDNQNTIYDMYDGWGQVKIRSIILPGTSTQAGDSILLTYDGNQKKRIYLPVMAGYNELYVGSDGSTYYDQWLCQTAQEALPPSPTPTPTLTPSPTPEGFRTPSPTPSPTPTPENYLTPTPSPLLTPTPLPYCCPMFYGDSVTLTNQSSTGNAGLYDSCLCCGFEHISWWTSCINGDWVEIIPEQGLNWNNYQMFVALGDASYLSPGRHQAEVFILDSCGGGTFGHFYINYDKPTPTPISTLTPPVPGTPTPTPLAPPTPSSTPSVTPSIAPTPPSLCSATFQFSDLEDLEIFTPRGSGRYDIVYQLKDVAGSISSWGHIFDNNNKFYDGQTGPGDVLLRSYVHAGFSTQTGDMLIVTYDGAQRKRVCLPALTGYTELYVGSDGSTYYDQWLCQTAQEALPPTPTPDSSPTPKCYCTLTPTPPLTPTPVPCVDCPSTSIESVTLTDQTTSGEFIYDFTKNCRQEPEHLFDWWSSCTDWLVVEPEQGFGFDSQLFELTVSLGDTSFLSQGLHSDWLSFSDNWGGCGTAVMEVRYYKETPIPTPTIIAPPTSSPTPSVIPSQTPTPSPMQTPTPTLSATPTISPTPIPTPQFLNPIIESGDYDGDGVSDIAVFRESSGLWAVKGLGSAYFGGAGDIPASGDYDGDGTADVAIFRGGSGLWGVRGVTRVYYGSSSDIPIPGDYDGDGSCDVGIFRPSSGLWAVSGVTRAYFGSSGDLPVPGDYNGDGTKDIALFRGSSGMWAIQGMPRVYYGSSSDSLVPGDYDGDGTWEVGIFRPNNGMWGIRGVTRAYYGSISDQPVPADFDGDGLDDIAIFRPSSGLWAVRGLTRAYFGGAGDIPVTR